MEKKETKSKTQRTINVKPTTPHEVGNKWGTIPNYLLKQPIFVKCNESGVVNWDKALIYTSSELKGKKVNVLFI